MQLQSGDQTKNILWGTPIYTFKNPAHSKIRNEAIAKCYELKEQKKKSEVYLHQKRNVYESAFNFFEHEKSCQAILELRQFMTQSIRIAISDTNKDLNWDPSKLIIHAHESWCHITGQGGYHDLHTHPMSSWGAIYYLQTGFSEEDKNKTKDIGVNRFYDPRTLANHFRDYATMHLDQRICEIVPEEGLIVVFPTYIAHSAAPFYGFQDRVIVACNTTSYHKDHIK